MIRRPPRSTRTDTLFPYTTLFRSPSIVNAHLHLARIYNTDFMLRLAGHDPAPLRARAFELSLRAAALEPANGHVHSTLAWCYLRRGAAAIGRASRRESVCKYESIWVFPVPLKKKFQT